MSATARIDELARRAVCALEALPDAGPDELVELLAEDVSFDVDWKAEGVFEHSKLFGRSRHHGRDAVRTYFQEVARHRRVAAVDIARTIVHGADVVLLGDLQWDGNGDGTASSSDFSLRLGSDEGGANHARFLTLPAGHLETFVPGYRTSDEFDSERIARLVRDFQKLYFDAYVLGRTWSETHWMGFPLFKCPLDVWVYQELIAEQRPDWIVETGTCAGGSALFFAHMCDLVGNGRILTVDLQPYSDPQPEHDRITYLLGSSTSDEVLSQVRETIGDERTVLVVLDSDHRCDHVYEEMHAYADMVSVGSYLIVEDSNLNGHPTKPTFGPGPMEAIDRFLPEDGRFRIDYEREKFLVTWNPRGYLLKISS